MVTLMGRSPSDGQHKNLGLEKAAGNEMPGTKQEAEATEEGKINSEVEVWKKKKEKKKKRRNDVGPRSFEGRTCSQIFCLCAAAVPRRQEL